MKEIKLTQEKLVMVDDEYYDELSKYKWYARKDLHTYYAQRKEKQSDGKWKIIHMHRVILNTPIGLKTDHIDRNGLNNQRINLRIVTHQENMMNMRKRKDNTSGETGVYFQSRDKKWYAMFNYKNKTYRSRYVLTKYEALVLRDEMKKDLGV